MALTLANQYLKQLAGDTLEAVMGNVGAIVAFQCGEHDARVISRLRPGFEAEDLMQLDKYRAGVYMRYQGETQPAFSLETLEPLKPEDVQAATTRESYLRHKSIANYTPLSQRDISDWLAQRYTEARPDVNMDVQYYDPRE